jgi:hypothetical protein
VTYNYYLGRFFLLIDKHKRQSVKFAPSLYFSQEPLFPRAWTTHGCTKWAVETCIAFIKEFEKRSGLAPKLDGFMEQLGA